jgi:hypothetical protein
MNMRAMVKILSPHMEHLSACRSLIASRANQIVLYRGCEAVHITGSELADSPAGGGQGRVSFGGVIFPRRLHRNQPYGVKPCMLRCYNKSGTAEKWIKEGKQAGAMARLSCYPLWRQ